MDPSARPPQWTALLPYVLSAVVLWLPLRLISQLNLEQMNLLATLVHGLGFFLYGLTLTEYRPNRRTLAILGSIAAGIGAYIFTLLHLPETDATQNAVGLLFAWTWFLGGSARLGFRRPRRFDWLDYLTLSAEALVWMAILLFFGGVLSLFGLILLAQFHHDAFTFFLENVVSFGGILSFFLGFGLAQSNPRLRLSRLVARFFLLPSLVLLGGYFALSLTETSPLAQDRDVLVVFSASLVLVLGLSLVSLTRDDQTLFTFWAIVSLGLLAVAMGVVSVVRIGLRTVQLGLSVNRFTVLGTNLLVTAHLGWVLVHLAQKLRGRTDIEYVRTAAVAPFPVYFVWLSFVVFALPLAQSLWALIP